MSVTIVGSSHRAATRLVLLLVLIVLGGCGSMHGHLHWPWRHAAPAPEPAVNELTVEFAPGADAPALPQSWIRNNLRVALTAVSGEGEFTLRPAPGHAWPMRLEFLVQPGAFAHLEVSGEQRVILSVPATGEATVLPVPLGVYVPATTALRLRYGP